MWDGLKIEIQLRTQLQHTWATAVESVGTFTRQALKANQGDENWQRFFALMSAALAAIERTPTVPGTPTSSKELAQEIRALATKLDVLDNLRAYSVTLNSAPTSKDIKYFVLKLDFDKRLVSYTGFKKDQSAWANRSYTEQESSVPEGANVQIVLVSVDSLKALKRAYPNYFLDTTRFGELVTRATTGRYAEPVVLQPQLFIE